MRILLEIENQKDLWTLMEYIHTLKQVKILVAPEIKEEEDLSPKQPEISGKNLGDFFGSAPCLDSKAFQQYLHKIRAEWERPTS